VWQQQLATCRCDWMGASALAGGGSVWPGADVAARPRISPAGGELEQGTRVGEKLGAAKRERRGCQVGSVGTGCG
jgi:hypothetical protein